MPDDEQVLRQVEQAMVRLRRSMGRRTLGRALLAELAQRAEPVDLTLFAVLDAVDDGPGPDRAVVTVREVGERMDLDPSRASRVVAGAVASGHLRRVAAQSDARQVGLELTEAGRGVVDLASRRRRAFFDQAMQGWSAAERAEFARLLARFSTAVPGS